MAREILVPLLAGAGLAVASSAHCALMCGALATSARVVRGYGGGLRYFVGRLTSYAVLGGIVGSLGQTLVAVMPRMVWLEAFASWAIAVMLLRTGLRQLGLASKRKDALLTLRTRPRRPGVVGRLLSKVADDPLLLGAATALLPCGALYAALAVSAALGSAGAGALAMATFATLSGLALLGVSQLAGLARFGVRSQRLLAVGMLLGAGVMVFRPIAALRSDAAGEVPACHRTGAEEP